MRIVLLISVDYRRCLFVLSQPRPVLLTWCQNPMTNCFVVAERLPEAWEQTVAVPSPILLYTGSAHCVQYPVCHKVPYVTSPLCTMPPLSSCRTRDPPFVYNTLYACHKPVVHHVPSLILSCTGSALCVQYPVCHRVPYVTSPLCTMQIVSQSRYSMVVSCLCTGLFVSR